MKLMEHVFVKQREIIKATDLFYNSLNEADSLSLIGLRREFTGGQLGCRQTLWESECASIRLDLCKKPFCCENTTEEERARASAITAPVWNGPTADTSQTWKGFSRFEQEGLRSRWSLWCGIQISSADVSQGIKSVQAYDEPGQIRKHSPRHVCSPGNEVKAEEWHHFPSKPVGSI